MTKVHGLPKSKPARGAEVHDDTLDQAVGGVSFWPRIGQESQPAAQPTAGGDSVWLDLNARAGAWSKG